MSSITDWLMVGITAVYVIATIFICRANIKSAEETRKQTAEMKREFDESNRPIVEAEFLLARRLIYVLRFSNRGRKTAQHVKINFGQEFIDSLQKGVFKNQLQKQQGKECIIGVDQHYDLHIGDFSLRANSNLNL